MGGNKGVLRSLQELRQDQAMRIYKRSYYFIFKLPTTWQRERALASRL